MNNTPTAMYYAKVVEKLGGMSPAKRDGYNDAIEGFPCIIYYNDNPETNENVLVGSFMFNLDKSGKELGFECDLYDESGEVIGNGSESCLSYEGTANASDTAGCFFKLEESVENVYKYYLDDSWHQYLIEVGRTEEQLTLDQFKELIATDQVDYYTYDEFLQEYDEIDYIKGDFEVRYSFNEDDDEVSYRPMVNLVNWVSDSIKDGTFKKDFEKHFDKTYMLAYYLQMQMFAQVDNCGFWPQYKNFL